MAQSSSDDAELAAALVQTTLQQPLEGGSFDGMEFAPFEAATRELFAAYEAGAGGEGKVAGVVGCNTLAQPLVAVFRFLYYACCDAACSLAGYARIIACAPWCCPHRACPVSSDCTFCCYVAAMLLLLCCCCCCCCCRCCYRSYCYRYCFGFECMQLLRLLQS